ncbi:MAG: chromosome segregation protein SMC [Planctomycetota bacterium]|jgi:chromosome segregation protein|nr:chromosome segregation protein SMC [Planctomycetota bacterium]
MRLKSIELFGFKSFPDRTVIDFGDANEITALLGPNGCGKSNIVDAIRWVLGERSAKSLRGDDMQDVIFSGCNSRHASGLAEVKLVFDNQDGRLEIPAGAVVVAPSEVSVARRLHRSGESEYLINHNPCRLKDIRDLFLDTGVSGSAYSVIEQGRVEFLLNAKPADRRQVFEEAAGIAGFKQQRKEILSRLERTDQVLIRVNDRVEERERQIRRVGGQASNARRYRRLASQLTTLKTFLFRRQYITLAADQERIGHERQELEAELAREDASLAQAIASLARVGAEEQDLLARREVVAGEVSNLQSELARLNLEQSQALNQSDRLREELERSGERQRGLGERRDRLQANLEAIQRDLAGAEAGLAELDGVIAVRENERNALAAASAATEARVGELRNRSLDLYQERQNLLSRANRLEISGQSLCERLNGLSERSERSSVEAAAVEQELAVLDGEFRQTAERAAGIQDRLEVARQRLDTLTRGEDDLRSEERARESALSGLSARQTTLQEQESSLAGAFEGVRNVMTASREGHLSCQGVVGLVSDILEVPRELALAVETLLGNASQDIVIASARDAEAAIGYLKSGRLGRATFLPLDRIKPRQRLDPSLGNLPGVVGEASQLVGSAPEHRGIVEHLLAGVLVVENLGRARELSGGAARGVKIVTPEGDVISPGGAMTGGQGRQQRYGLVQQKAELRAVGEAVQEAKKHLAELGEKHLALTEELSQCRQSIHAHEVELAETGWAEAGLKQNLAVGWNRLERARAEGEAVAQERQGLEDGAGDWQGELALIQGEISGLDQTLATLNAELADASNQQRVGRDTLDQLSGELSARQAERAGDYARVEDLRRRLGETEGELGACATELAAGFDPQPLEQEISHRAEEIARCQLQEEAFLRQREQQQSVLTELGEFLAARRGEMESQRSLERGSQLQITRLRDGLRELDRRLAQCEAGLDSLQGKAREELGLENLAPPPALPASEPEEEGEGEVDGNEEVASLPPPPAEENPWENLTDSELQSEVTQLARKISNIGPVNFDAIDELAELEASAEFLQAQKEDLEAAVADMRQTIDTVNQKSSDRFQETFVKVRENFQELFTSLFGGGSADLVLEELPEGAGDPLDAGVDIVARPPGKAPKSISLLSGGEKALCAVALLLALFRSKPSPFCILDEVDGPLDEANIDRFMEQTRIFSQLTQFIIITHSQRTMSLTDKAWGVSQREKGVSSIFSIHFEKMAAAVRRGKPAASPSPEVEDEREMAV